MFELIASVIDWLLVLTGSNIKMPHLQENCNHYRLFVGRMSTQNYSKSFFVSTKKKCLIELTPGGNENCQEVDVEDALEMIQGELG